MKTCKSCHERKPYSDYFKDKGLADGHAGTCKVCKTKKTYAWRERNKDKYNSYMRAKNKEHYQNYRLTRYGVDDAWYQETLKAQNHQCAICKKPNPSTKRCLAVDHCHTTGKVRGILCYGCNRLMALLDNESLLQTAIAYKKKAV